MTAPAIASRPGALTDRGARCALLLLALLTGGCPEAAPADTIVEREVVGVGKWPWRTVYTWRDFDRGVSCWVVDTGNGSSISCLPDSQLKDGGR